MSIECFSCKIPQTQPLFFDVDSKIYSSCSRCAKKKFDTLSGEPIEIRQNDKWKNCDDVYRDRDYNEICPQYSSVTKQGDKWKRQVELPTRILERQQKKSLPSQSK